MSTVPPPRAVANSSRQKKLNGPGNPKAHVLDQGRHSSLQRVSMHSLNPEADLVLRLAQYGSTIVEEIGGLVDELTLAPAHGNLKDHAAHFASSTILSAIRSALAMMVNVGGTPPIVGSALPSQTKSPSIPCTRPPTSQTEVARSLPMRQLPACKKYVRASPTSFAKRMVFKRPSM